MHTIKRFAFILIALVSLSAFSDASETTTPDETVQATPTETILVAGATGKTGRFVIEQLDAQNYPIRAMTRSVARASETFGESDTWVEADAKDLESLRTAMEGVDKIICTIGATAATGENGPEFVDYGGVKNLVDAALEAEIKHFVLVSSMGATQEDHFLNKVFGDVLKWKFKGEEYLRQSGLSYTIVRPGGLQNMPGGMMEIVFQQGDPVGPDRLVTRADVAAITVEALTNENAANKTFEVYNNAEQVNPNWRDALADLVTDDVLNETN